MSSELQQPKIPSLSDGYSKAKGSALVAAGLLILVDLGKVDLTKPIPMLGLSIPDPSVVKAVLCVVATYGALRMTLEWFQSDPARRKQTSPRIDYILSFVLTLFVIGRYLLQPFDFQAIWQIPLIPSLILATFGFIFGGYLSVWISSLEYVRTREEALRLGLHRRPYAIRATHAFIPLWLIAIGIIYALSPWFSRPLARIWIFLLIGPATIGFLGGCIDLFRSKWRAADGTVSSRKARVAQMRRIFEWHDATYQMNGWDKRAPNEHTPLYKFCERGDLENVKQLLETRVPIDLPELHGWTPLMIAVAENHFEVVDLLLQKGANPNIANFQGRTPLSFAARYGRKDLVKLLLRFGANPNFREGLISAPPLESAAEHGHKEIVEVLLEAGADPVAKTHWKTTAQEVAQAAQHGEIAAVLRKASAKKPNS